MKLCHAELNSTCCDVSDPRSSRLSNHQKSQVLRLQDLIIMLVLVKSSLAPELLLGSNFRSMGLP